jgi:MscS family membrane protein
VIAGEPKPGAAASAKAAPPADTLGRSTPYGAVMGFLLAADSGDYKTAVRYLEGKESEAVREQRARDLAVVLNRGLKIGTDALSKVPEGRLDDDLTPYLEKVGTAVYGTGKLDILLRRTTSADTPPVWLFSSDTLAAVSTVAGHFDLPWAEAVWAPWFRESRFIGIPLFRLLNTLIVTVLTMALAWLVTVGLIAAARALVRRHRIEYVGRELERMRWLLWLLVFAIAARIAASEAVTVAVRLITEYVANVIIVVAVSWILVRMTRLAADAKIHHLRQASSPAQIAAVKMLSWLVMCVWVVTGLFLILRSFGVELTAAIAGLGVGTIAIAFAAQKTLENLFGTVMIVSDEIVKVGDPCQAGTVEGQVESIGLRSTRVRTADRTLVTIPNGQLAAMSVGNPARRDKFLFRHTIRLPYETTAAELRSVLARIVSSLDKQPHVEIGSGRVRLVQFGSFAIELQATAYVLTASADVFQDTQQELLLRIMDAIEATGLALASPPSHPLSALTRLTTE